MMSSDPLAPGDLLDLKMLPSWLKESDPVSYEHYQGNEGAEETRRPRRPGGPDRQRRPQRPREGSSRERDNRGPKGQSKDRRPQGSRPPGRAGAAPDRPRRPEGPPPEDLSGRVAIRFLPYGPALESVVSQIKSNPLSYSVFALARLFLEKPERYEVNLIAKEGAAPFYRLGETGGISLNREQLEESAFRLARNEFYRVDVTQGEPIKGNFPTVARCRLSGTVLGPTNHHAYQPKLRALYDQRFSRRMSFPEFQRQIEIVNDPSIVEQWKEEARNVTTFTTTKEEPALTFSTAAEAERHFRIHYLPGLVQSIADQTIGGVQSRQLQDRRIGRFIEMSWANEIRSPSQIMQELSARLRDHGLQIYRHRRGMLFVSGVRPKIFALREGQAASPQVQQILQTIEGNRGIKKKELADKILGEVSSEDGEPRKLALASDLRWLISEGHVIEFNDGSLDLPRVKAPQPQGVAKTEGDASDTSDAMQTPESADAAVATSVTQEATPAVAPAAEPAKPEEQL
jgi:hypothetical protein